tara:strand:+ start:3728 stop:4522 length:795 start_codon:yes stop_codon:yes gene_type:complete
MTETVSLKDVVRNTSARADANGYPPVRLNIQGVDGIGKSTFGASADDAIFIQAEDGLKFIDAQAFPLCDEWEDIVRHLAMLANEQHSFKTIVLDTTDAASILAEAHVCKKNKWESIETPGYGKGFTAVAEEFVRLLGFLDFLVNNKNMNVILLSHVAVKPFNDPTNEGYDRWEMRCHKKVNHLIKDWVDFNLFANYDVNVDKDGSKNRATSYGNRSLHTKFSAGFDAKSRLDIPPKLPFEWNAFLDAYKTALNPAQLTVAKGAK